MFDSNCFQRNHKVKIVSFSLSVIRSENNSDFNHPNQFSNSGYPYFVYRKPVLNGNIETVEKISANFNSNLVFEQSVDHNGFSKFMNDHYQKNTNKNGLMTPRLNPMRKSTFGKTDVEKSVYANYFGFFEENKHMDNEYDCK